MADHIHELKLQGCTPTPLAGYLKALGVLRLVAEQADPDAKGFWRDEHFWLRTKLSEEELLGFFLNDYAPSPIIAPWNGGSGFYKKDNQKGIAPLRETECLRFSEVSSAIKLGDALIDEMGLSQRPANEEKQAMLAQLRTGLSNKAIRWLDAAVAITTDTLVFPPLLGTGGNDGRLDFTNNFMQRLVTLFDVDSGEPRRECPGLLAVALDGMPGTGLINSAVGQFAPGAAGGPNAGTGYDSGSLINPWDFILLLEGALLFAGGVTKRLQGAD